MNTPKRIKLNGGPKDGEVIVIADIILQYRRLEVHIAPPISAFNYVTDEPYPVAVVHLKTGCYELRRMCEGDPNTCEFREWTEWHWDGTPF